MRWPFGILREHILEESLQGGDGKPYKESDEADADGEDKEETDDFLFLCGDGELHG